VEGENLIKQLGDDKNRNWHDLIENIYMTKDSKKACCTEASWL